MLQNKSGKKSLSTDQAEELLAQLEARFKKKMKLHKDMEWSKVLGKLKATPKKLWSINQMEKTGGEPDVVEYDKKKDNYVFMDCSKESPMGRRSVCYDQEALESRKKHKPENSALGMAKDMGVELLSEDEYRKLQDLGEFDTKTSSWLKTPEKIRKLGGAIFGDRRFNTVFIYHNGADSYYGTRAFRAKLIV